MARARKTKTTDKPQLPLNPPAGTKLNLGKMTPLYASATSDLPRSMVNGPVYIWGAARENGRLRVCRFYSEVGMRGRVWGYMEWGDLNEQI